MTLTGVALTGKERGPGSGLKIRKVRETSLRELVAETLRWDPDRCLRPGGERERDPPAGRGDTGELVEERDHVRERDEVEAAVGIRKVRSIGLLEGHAAGELRWRLAPGLLHHPRREVGADHLGLRESPRNEERAEAGAGSEVEPTRGLAVDVLQCLLEGSERVRAPHLVPARREVVELGAHQRPERSPEARP